MAVSTPTDKRFRRAQVRPARRRRVLEISRRRLLQVLLVAVIAFVAVDRLVERVVTSGLLQIRGITLSGGAKRSADDVLSRLDGLRGQNMFAIDIEEWRQRVLESPWVEAVAIRRVLPGVVDVSVVEREPMAIGRIGRALYLIDQSGGVIDEFGPAYAEFDLPLVDGLAAQGAASNGQPEVDAGRAALAGRLLTALQSRPDLAGRVSQIDVTDVNDAVVILQGDTVLVRVGSERFADRLQAYLDLAPTIRGEVPQIDYADMRFDEKVYVRPQSRRGGGQNVAGGG
jgi:cell division septal protein FtsQ